MGHAYSFCQWDSIKMPIQTYKNWGHPVSKVMQLLPGYFVYSWAKLCSQKMYPKTMVVKMLRVKLIYFLRDNLFFLRSEVKWDSGHSFGLNWLPWHWKPRSIRAPGSSKNQNICNNNNQKAQRQKKNILNV